MNITRKIPKTQLALLKKIGGLADKEKIRAWCVGGYVRDLVLGIRDYDLDIVIEADAVNFARRAAKALKAEVIYHKKFKTATLNYRKNYVIDFVTARSEVYLHPAALPNVKPAAIKEDLLRRDFTINTLAFSINSDNFGEVLDLTGGLGDLKEKKIRVLHNKSFIDDPTRIFRAVRLAVRFGFKIEPKTLKLMRQAVKKDMVNQISGERLRKEYLLIGSEKKSLKIIHEIRKVYYGS